MSQNRQSLQEARAALDRLTVEGIEAADVDEVRALEAAAHHWAEIAASAVRRRVAMDQKQDKNG